jgi:hypothetical protein
MGIDIGFATPADDASIRGLLHREPVGGRIAISYERDPDFAIGCEASGENVTVLVARDLERDAVVGLACRSEREVYLNSMPTRLGYLGQLRIDRRYRGRWLVSRGYCLLKRLHERNPLPGYLAAVTMDNREAAGILVERPRKLFPSFHRIADYHTLALRVKHAARAPGIQAATPNDIPEIVRFLQSEGPRRQFFPVWTTHRLLALIDNLGLRLEDIQIARRDGSIAGLMSMWDQSAFKQNVVRSYAGWMKLAVPLYNATAPWLKRPRLPLPGEKIRNAYAALVCVAGDDTAVFRDLLAATLERAATCGLDYLLLGLDERDPLLGSAREHPHILYQSRLYLAEWPEGGRLHARLDHRPSYVEIATL